MAGGDAFIVALSGHLDVYRVSEVRRLLRQAAAQQRLIVDMSDVASISAAILTEFVRCYKRRMMEGLQPARLVVQTEPVRRIFEITDLAKVWPIFDSVAAASAP